METNDVSSDVLAAHVKEWRRNRRWRVKVIWGMVLALAGAVAGYCLITVPAETAPTATALLVYRLFNYYMGAIFVASLAGLLHLWASCASLNRIFSAYALQNIEAVRLDKATAYYLDFVWDQDRSCTMYFQPHSAKQPEISPLISDLERMSGLKLKYQIFERSPNCQMEFEIDTVCRILIKMAVKWIIRDGVTPKRLVEELGYEGRISQGLRAALVPLVLQAANECRVDATSDVSTRQKFAAKVRELLREAGDAGFMGDGSLLYIDEITRVEITEPH